jgi:adenosine deaminase
MDNMDRKFIEAIEQRNIAEIRKIPKSDLHNHFILGGNRDYIHERTGVQIPLLNEKLLSMDEMHKWVSENIGEIFNSKEKRVLAIESCFMQAKNDGVTILEIGDDVWANGYYYNNDIDELIRTFQNVHMQIAPEIEFRSQIGLSRHCNIDILEKWIEPFWDKECFKSIDLYSDEMAQPIKNFKKIYRKAKEKGLLLKAHVGEWGNADSVKEAVEELELDEVQHGISAANSQSVMNWLTDNKIQLNICPTSNVMLGRVDSLKVHPIRRLFDNGIKVTINSDDVLVFNQGVSEEFLDLYTEGVFKAEELEIIRKYGLNC